MSGQRIQRIHRILQVAKVYNSIRDMIKTLIMTRVGNLIALHMIEMMAEFGILPSWLQTYACFDHTGSVFKWYAPRFNFPCNQTQARRLMALLPTGMELQLGHRVVRGRPQKLGLQEHTTGWRGRPSSNVIFRGEVLSMTQITTILELPKSLPGLWAILNYRQ
jgi:hypothetical protein